jgi:hypothetical protein
MAFSLSAYNDIRTHSAWLYNERVAVLFYLLDTCMLEVNQSYNVTSIKKSYSLLYQIWKNTRSIVRSSTSCRIELNLDTKDPGTYTPDVAIGAIQRMILYCDFEGGYTYERAFVIVQRLNAIEMLLRDILQYFNYFMRPAFKQKPDILTASDEYKKTADKLTVQQLQEVLGSRHKIDLPGIQLAMSDKLRQIELSSDDEEELAEEDDAGTDDELDDTQRKNDAPFGEH